MLVLAATLSLLIALTRRRRSQRALRARILDRLDALGRRQQPDGPNDVASAASTGSGTDQATGRPAGSDVPIADGQRLAT